MKGRFIIDGDFFTRFNISKRNEEDVIVENLHVRVWLARVIDVMRAVPASAAIETPAIVDGADSQLASARSSISLGVSDPLTGILGNFSSTGKV